MRLKGCYTYQQSKFIPSCRRATKDKNLRDEIEEANFFQEKKHKKKRLTTAMNHLTRYFNWIYDNDISSLYNAYLYIRGVGILSKNSQVRAIEMKTPLTT